MEKKFKFDVFISYSTKDWQLVLPLATRLKKDGLNVWLDRWAILPGEPISLSISAALEQSRALLMCMSPSYFKSEWTKFEHHTLIFRDPTNIQRRFIPLRLKEGTIPDVIAQFAYIDWVKCTEENYQKIFSACLTEEAKTNSVSIARVVEVTAPTKITDMNCKSCGKPIKGEWKKCPSCGCTLRSRCYKCGKEAEAEQDFCTNCGAAVSELKVYENYSRAIMDLNDKICSYLRKTWSGRRKLNKINKLSTQATSKTSAEERAKLQSKKYNVLYNVFEEIIKSDVEYALLPSDAEEAWSFIVDINRKKNKIETELNFQLYGKEETIKLLMNGIRIAKRKLATAPDWMKKDFSNIINWAEQEIRHARSVIWD